MTPTANKLYQLVRKGSMTAPAEALNKFWEDLREKSRVRIEHPDLPEALKTAAGDLTATLWTAAQALAHETLASYRSEMQVAIMDAQSAVENAESERDTMLRERDEALRGREEASRRVSALEQNLAAAVATRMALESHLKQAMDDNAVHQQRLEDARREFTSELEKLRVAAHLADERFRAAETRTLLEIDRERTRAAKLQKELDACRIAGTQAVERLRSEATGLQSQLGDLRQNTGILEGNLQAVTASRDMTVIDLKAVQAQLAEVAAKLGSLLNEGESWRLQAEEAQRMVAELRKAPKPVRVPRKSKTE
jgi:chromosome segregation ATPase